MADGQPKDYGSIFSEDSSAALAGRHYPHQNQHLIHAYQPQGFTGQLPAPVVPIPGERARRDILPSEQNIAPPLIPSRHSKQQAEHGLPEPKVKSLDGGFVGAKHREQKQIDMLQVVAKLNRLARENNPRTHALETLNQHFSLVFPNRRRQQSAEQSAKEKRAFRVYIHYVGEKETYVVRVDQNNLRSIKDKMPIRGNFRYFFRSRPDDVNCEEVEFDNNVVPYHHKEGQRHIYCQVFRKQQQ